jgi:decaprenylphospho-beta-D-erythro-pentofuranosid-2-ulose 2-reductase
MTTILALGASSAIVFETLRPFATEHASIIMVGRSREKLEVLAQDLTARGAHSVDIILNDLSTVGSAAKLLEQVQAVGKDIDIVYLGYGTLPEQEAVFRDAQQRAELFQTNLLSAMDHVCLWYDYFIAAKRPGTLAVISSVAGDKGRGSNFLYGATKAGLDAFLSGVRNIGYKHGISVMTIKPGFVDSPMTAHVPKNLLFVSAAQAGAIIHKAIKRRTDIVYVPWFWRFILFLIKMLPESIFKRLSL